MYQIPGDYLMTYNPGATEQHSDSSDFESDVSPKVSKIVGKHCLLDKNLKKKTEYLKYINQQVLNQHYINDTNYDTDTRKSSWKVETVRSSKLFKTNKKVRRKRCNRVKSKDLNCGDQVEVGQSKVSIIRCISSIFGRYVNNVKHTMSIIKENHPENVTKDNCCQAHRGQKGTRIFDNEQCYSIRPVYEITSIKNGAHAPCQTKMKNIHKNRNQPSKNQYSITSLSLSSSDAPIEKQADDDAHRKFKKRLISEIKQEYLQYRFAHMKKNQEQQCPSKLNNENPFQAITTSYQLLSKPLDSTSSDPNTIKKVQSSKFWDFIYEKICKRYQGSKGEKTGSSTCLKNQSSQNQQPCGPSNCERYKGGNSPDSSSPTGIPEQNPNSTCIGGVDKISADNPLSLKKEPNKTDVGCTIECRCFPIKKMKPARAAKSIMQKKTSKAKSCQESHDPITEALAQKYNGEILCIHNPPCVLINGCLNLVNPKELNEDVNLWPVIKQEHSFTYKKNTYSQQYNYIEQSSQYAAPLLEMVECQTPDYKAEKIIQSVCNHDPPCEVVRGCYKQKYEPMQLTSRDRLPTIHKLLECLNEQKDDKVSDNSTQYADIAHRNVFLTARGDVSTQVKSKIKMVCRHVPPCIMLPSCLARVVYGSCMTIEAIPDCLHRPPCDLIPACCRRQTKGMASVSSQYPNGCRVV